MSAKTQSDLSQAQQHVNAAIELIGRGGDRVQASIQHLAFALNDLLKQLDG